MLNIFNRWKAKGQEDFVTPEDTSVIFHLKYKHLPIGVLELKAGKWSFRYTDEFKNQERLKPLPDFPKLEKVYESEELYPFFLHRIPSTKQPKVQKTIADNNIDATNEVDLLRWFGREAITNPFVLYPA